MTANTSAASNKAIRSRREPGRGRSGGIKVDSRLHKNFLEKCPNSTVWVILSKDIATLARKTRFSYLLRTVENWGLINKIPSSEDVGRLVQGTQR